eukprot:CAMPEP_0114637526 /NCGR_PEP_ID=MMETSP0191-20121206/145_1 /TAXON_ID=126664 /ORGANISM="Sorites sp." /LENGTH=50 /DNA_ID=CAMNT_0001849255 /DNA_START=728 /DNA_END=876 /DNA_ORIENTATION=+
MFVQHMQLAEPQQVPAEAPRRRPGVAQRAAQHATDLPISFQTKAGNLDVG